MPHTLSMPASGFQAVILCGPGVSLTTFTANPEEFPKALVPIANRPMVWYPLDWCYRMGITSQFNILRFFFLRLHHPPYLAFSSVCFHCKDLKNNPLHFDDTQNSINMKIFRVTPHKAPYPQNSYASRRASLGTDM